MAFYYLCMVNMNRMMTGKKLWIVIINNLMLSTGLVLFYFPDFENVFMYKWKSESFFFRLESSSLGFSTCFRSKASLSLPALTPCLPVHFSATSQFVIVFAPWVIFMLLFNSLGSLMKINSTWLSQGLYFKFNKCLNFNTSLGCCVKSTQWGAFFVRKDRRMALLFVIAVSLLCLQIFISPEWPEKRKGSQSLLLLRRYGAGTSGEWVLVVWRKKTPLVVWSNSFWNKYYISHRLVCPESFRAAF